MTTALFLGRFQPFHKGHLCVLRRAAKEHSKVIVAVGSSQHYNTQKNPFTYTQRKAMINLCVKELPGVRIVPLPDIGSDERYVAYTQKKLPPFDVVYTGNPHTRLLFQKKGIKVVFLRRRYLGISATKLRAAMQRGAAWTKYVPLQIRLYLRDLIKKR